MNASSPSNDEREAIIARLSAALDLLQQDMPNTERAAALLDLKYLCGAVAPEDHTASAEPPSRDTQLLEFLELLEQSSLGTKTARHVRRRSSPDISREIARRLAGGKRPCPESSDLATRAVVVDAADDGESSRILEKARSVAVQAGGPSNPGDKPQVVVGIDLGTYSSAFAWTTVDDQHDDPLHRTVLIHDQWVGHAAGSGKTFTSLLISGNDDVVTWGHSAKQMARPMSTTQVARMGLKHSFKMALGRPHNDIVGRIGSAAPDDCNVNAECLLMLCLRQLRRLAVREIANNGISEDAIQWRVAVPANWDDRQKDLVRRAAAAAGFPSEEGRLLLALEPDAAVQHALASGVWPAEPRGTEGSWATGSRFVVADCGAGTVDLTAYQASDAGIVEVGTSSGTLGSAYLNAAFEKLVMRPRLGGDSEYQRLLKLCPEGIVSVLDSWELAKRSVHIGHPAPIYLQMPLPLAMWLSHDTACALTRSQHGVGDCIVVQPHEIKEIFDSVVQGIVKLVDEQMDFTNRQPGRSAPVESVMLVGGFANSPYLRQTLIEHLEGRAKILVPPTPDLAVLSGTVAVQPTRPAVAQQCPRRSEP